MVSINSTMFFICAARTKKLINIQYIFISTNNKIYPYKFDFFKIYDFYPEVFTIWYNLHIRLHICIL